MKKILIFALTLTIYSCSNKHGQIESAITKKIDHCGNSDCLIRLSEITNFDWDKAYFILAPVDNEYLNQILGLKYENYQEFTHSIIFLNKNKIIYSENNEASVENLTDDQIVIQEPNVPDTAKCRVFTKQTAVFKGKIKSYNNIRYYELVPCMNEVQ
jgi:hypothetical protein